MAPSPDAAVSAFNRWVTPCAFFVPTVCNDVRILYNQGRPELLKTPLSLPGDANITDTTNKIK